MPTPIIVAWLRVALTGDDGWPSYLPHSLLELLQQLFVLAPVQWHHFSFANLYGQTAVTYQITFGHISQNPRLLGTLIRVFCLDGTTMN
jgi:hypothetical protein